MRVFTQNTQTTPRNKHFSTLEFTVVYVFHAEVLAISEMAKNLLLEKMHNQSIVVLVDTRAPIKCTVASITVFNCIRNLNQLGKQNHVSIAWIPGYAGVHGNEVADYVSKSGSKSKNMVLNVLLQFRMPAGLARLRTGPQIDGNLCGMNGKTA